MINRSDMFEEFQKNISDLIAKSPAADIERNVKAMMAQTFSRLELVTREELEVQTQLLERAIARVTALEARVQALEGRPGAANRSDAGNHPEKPNHQNTVNHPDTADRPDTVNRPGTSDLPDMPLGGTV